MASKPKGARRRLAAGIAVLIVSPALAWVAVHLSSSEAATTTGAGATLPFSSYEAEAGTLGGGAAVQWQPVPVSGGYYRLVARNSGLCLGVPNASTSNGVQLQQSTCNGSSAQAFRLVQQP